MILIVKARKMCPSNAVFGTPPPSPLPQGGLNNRKKTADSITSGAESPPQGSNTMFLFQIQLT
jgi:hypothetical protein